MVQEVLLDDTIREIKVDIEMIEIMMIETDREMEADTEIEMIGINTEMIETETEIIGIIEIGIIETETEIGKEMIEIEIGKEIIETEIEIKRKEVTLEKAKEMTEKGEVTIEKAKETTEKGIESEKEMMGRETKIERDVMMIREEKLREADDVTETGKETEKSKRQILENFLHVIEEVKKTLKKENEGTETEPRMTKQIKVHKLIVCLMMNVLRSSPKSQREKTMIPKQTINPISLKVRKIVRRKAEVENLEIAVNEMTIDFPSVSLKKGVTFHQFLPQKQMVLLRLRFH